MVVLLAVHLRDQRIPLVDVDVPAFLVVEDDEAQEKRFLLLQPVFEEDLGAVDPEGFEDHGHWDGQQDEHSQN